MGLGSLHIVSLADARTARDAAHRLLRDGIDPIETRKAELQRRRVESAKMITFKEAALACIKDREAEWRNPEHARQWPTTLADYAHPIIGDLSVGTIDTALVMKVLQQEVDGRPLWLARSETASRLRGRIEAVLDWAKVRGYRDGENPARWRGHLDTLLPKKSKVKMVKQHEAIDYREIGALMTALRTDADTTAKALEFTILTAARTGEIIGARWSEIDFRTGVWTVPAERMKARKEHRVPLSEAAIAVLDGEKEQNRGEFVFMTLAAQPLSDGAMRQRLQRGMGHAFTTHGMRAAFKTWASERTNYATETIELSLAHAVGSKVEAAYRRTDLFEKRRRLMADWADYCGTVPAPDAKNVVPLRAAALVPG
jgi:integrase